MIRRQQSNENRAKDLNTCFTKEDTGTANSHMQNCQASLTSGEMKIKITMRHHYKPPACVCESFSRAQLFATQWTIAYQALLSMGFSGQEYWSELPFPSPNPVDWL